LRCASRYLSILRFTGASRTAFRSAISASAASAFSSAVLAYAVARASGEELLITGTDFTRTDLTVA